MTRDPADYPLLRGQTALLAQALRLVSRDGYRYWQVQTAPTDRILAAVRTLDAVSYTHLTLPTIYSV